MNGAGEKKGKAVALSSSTVAARYILLITNSHRAHAVMNPQPKSARRTLGAVIVAASLSGCAIVPLDHPSAAHVSPVEAAITTTVVAVGVLQFLGAVTHFGRRGNRGHWGRGGRGRGRGHWRHR